MPNQILETKFLVMQKSYDKPRQCIKKQKHHFTDKGPYSQMATHSSVLAWRIPWVGEPGGLPSMGLPRVGHDWSDLAAPKNWLKIVVLEKTLESPMDSMDIKRVNPEGNQPWACIGRTDWVAEKQQVVSWSLLPWLAMVQILWNLRKVIDAGDLPVRNGGQKGLYAWELHRAMFGFTPNSQEK